MKKLLLAGLAVGMLTAAAPMSSALPPEPTPYRGGCGFDTVNQETATGQSWIGEANVIIVASDPTASVTNVSCQFYINSIDQGIVLTAPNGTGVTANAGRFEFSGSDTDITTMCTNVTINGTSYHDCANGEVTQIPPQAVLDAINTVIGILNDNVFEGLDSTICAALAILAPHINDLDQPGIIWIDNGSPTPPEVDKGDDAHAGDFDLYLLGAGFWDCPPYEPSTPGS